MWNPLKFFRKANIDSLLGAVEQGDVGKTRQILQKHPEFINKKNDKGMSPLMYATLLGRLEIIKHLLQAGANPNLFHQNESSPLMVAVLEEQAEVLQLLMEAPSTNLDQQDRYGATALMYAVRMGKEKPVRYLLKAGADPNLRDIEGETALMYAVGTQNKEVIQALLEGGAEVALKNFDGLSVLDKVIDDEIEGLLRGGKK